MAISDTDVREFYNGDGVNVDFTIPFDFELDENTQVKVYIVTVTDGVVTATLQTEGALQDYTLTGGDIPNSVNYTTVTFNTAPAASDDVLVVRSTPRTQGDSYTNSSSVANVTIMNALDYLTRLVQELGEEADRSVKFRVGSQQVDIPIDEPTAGEFLAWAGDGNSIVSSSGELGTVTVGSGTGLMAKDTASTTVVRTLTGTASEISVADGDGVSGNPTVGLADDPVIPGTGAVKVPVGTTAERRDTPNEGDLRANSDTSAFEGYIGGAWGSIGGAGGAGGINYISDNSDFEAGTGGWATFLDAAASTPTDGTGGTANITLTASSSSPLRGTQSGLITKDAANRQGEGASYDFTIDSTDKSKTLSLSFDLEASSAFVVGDDSDVQVFIYDVTNTTLITPKVSGISGTSGQFLTTWESTDSTSYRLIFHVATTNASAWTFKFDNVNVGPREVILGPIVGDWQSYTPTFTGFGTPTDVNFWYKQVGDDLLIRGNFVTGTTTATEGLVSLPSGKTIDTTKINSTANIEVFGLGLQPTGGAASNWVTDSTAQKVSAFYDGVNTDSFEITNQGASDVNNSRLANALWASGERIIFPLLVIPIANASSNVAIGTASTFPMAPILANGTRVTSTPTKLGEYRTLTKGTGTTATDGAPTDSPSSTNGMRIYSAYRAGAGGAGEANEWQIFCGKNKNVRVEFYGSTGKTQPIDTRMVIFDTGGGLNARGINVNAYDPTTGLLSLVAYFDSGSVASDNVGRTQTSEGNEATNVGSCYFDVIVSENVQAIGYEPEDYHEYFISQAGTAVTDGAGEIEYALGSATISEEGGNLITAADDSGNTRTTFTIARRSFVSVQYNYFSGGVDTQPAVYVNGTLKDRGASIASALWASVSTRFVVNAGDVITVGSASGAGVRTVSANLASLRILAERF